MDIVYNLKKFIPDKLYIRMQYFKHFHHFPSLKNPKTFNEKLQWLKLYDRRSEYTMMVDKYEVRKYIAEKIGEEYLIPLLGVWDSVEDINFALLPNQFVLKCTHDSGSVVICPDKPKFNIEEAKIKLSKAIKKNAFYYGREWPYKNVKPRIIGEKYMVDESGYELKDYKIFCFNGVPKIMLIATDRATEGEETKFDFFDMNFEHLPFTNGHPNASRDLKCPESFENMKNLAENLSKDIPQVRIDFYEINGNVYFGEITLSHWSGMMRFNPDEWDKRFGKWIELPERIG